MARETAEVVGELPHSEDVPRLVYYNDNESFVVEWLRKLIDDGQCLDGKWRRIEPRFFPLAHGVPNRVGRLRAYGNAIVPQVAATFIRAFMDAR